MVQEGLVSLQLNHNVLRYLTGQCCGMQFRGRVSVPMTALPARISRVHQRDPGTTDIKKAAVSLSCCLHSPGPHFAALGCDTCGLIILYCKLMHSRHVQI